jgi:hypothetical protein
MTKTQRTDLMPDTDLAGTARSPLSDAPMRSVTSGALRKSRIRSF